MPLELDYYYGNEAEQYNFYRIPKALLTDHHYKSVSLEAKVLYGLMLDRMGLSVRNGWLDSDGRVYIYFTQEDAMAMLSCGKDKATKLFRELDGIGLIERRKQGQGRPTRIYVKNFILPPGPGQAQEPTAPAAPKPETPQTAENQQSEPWLLAETAPQTAVFPQSGPLEKRSQECGFSASNKTEKKKTERSDTDPSILPPTPAARDQPAVDRNRSRMRMDEMDRYRELIKDNIDFDLLVREHPYEADTLEGYVELMVEVCCSRKDFLRIGGENIAAGVVKSRMLKLDRDHISYVLECMNSNTTLIRNIKAYTLAALYNAPVTMGQYYASQVSHDMAQGWQGD